MKKLLSFIIAAVLLFSLVPQNAFASVTWLLFTRDQAIQRYHDNYDKYVMDELVKEQQYRENYKNIKGSLADKLIERAFWYMDNGYTVYGHGALSYHSDGVVDCSEFVKLVYLDFKFILTDIAKNYGTVGTRVKGVYPVKENGKWKIVGTENLKPGDILTWTKPDQNGTKYIYHVAIYIGQLNGQPAIIGTTTGSDSDPTALGIINNFNYSYGEHFFSAQRVLPSGSWTPGKTFTDHPEKLPVIPEKYVLPPQKPITMPDVPPINEDPRPIVMTNLGWVTVRQTPSDSAPSIGRLELGEEALLVKQYNSYWYQVIYRNKLGYVPANSKYTRIEKGNSTNTGPIVLTNTGAVIVRQTPSSTGQSVGSLKFGEEAPLIKKYNAYWYQIIFNDKIAYITTNTKYTHFQSESTPYTGPVVATNTGWVTVFETPSDTGPSLGRLELGVKAPLIKKYNAYWYQINFKDKIGYISTNSKYTHIENENSTNTGPVVVSKTDGVIVRMTPSSTGLIIGKMELGEETPLMRKYNAYWYKVIFDNKIGYISTNTKYTLTQSESTPYTGPVVVTNSGWVTVRKTPSSTGETIGKLELGQEAPLIQRYNSYWYEIKFNNQISYITANPTYTTIENN